MDNLTKQQRSYCMSRIRAKDTKIELILRSELHKRGLRFRVNYDKLNGKPDIVFVSKRVAVFIDGEFWHGYDWEKRKKQIKSNRKYWIKKIEGNMERDKKNTKMLRKQGYRVKRIWGQMLKKNLEKYADQIEKMVRNA